MSEWLDLFIILGTLGIMSLLLVIPYIIHNIWHKAIFSSSYIENKNDALCESSEGDKNGM